MAQPHLLATPPAQPTIRRYETATYGVIYAGTCRCGQTYYAPLRTKLSTKLKAHYTRCTKRTYHIPHQEAVCS